MNNRMDELNSLINETSNMPDQMGMDNIRRTTKRKVFRHRVISGVRNTAIALGVLLASFAVGVNTSPVFANAVKDIPVLKDMAAVLNFNDGIGEALANQYGSPVNIECKGKDYNLYVDYVMADDKSIALFFKTDDDGAKRKLIMDVAECKDANGDPVASNYTLPYYCSDGKYSMLLLEDITYSDKFTFDLEVRIYDNSDEYCENQVGEENYKFAVEVPEKYEPKVFNINKNVDAGKAKFCIEQVRIYPLSTEIDVRYLNDDEVRIGWMNFALVDDKGNRIEAVANGTTGRADDSGLSTRVIESGYFNADKNLKLILDSVEYVSTDREIVTLDLNTLTFYDSYGPVKELTKAIYEEAEQKIEYELTIDKNWKYENMFDGYIDANDQLQYYSYSSMSGDGRYFIFLNEGLGDFGEKIYINESNQIKLFRVFPDAVVDPEISIELN